MMLAFQFGARRLNQPRIVLSSGHRLIQRRLHASSLAGFQAKSYSSKNCSSKDIGPQDFSNAAEAFKTKSNKELFRGWFVYSLLSSHTLVKNSEWLLKKCRMCLGKRIFDKLMKATLYGQFVAGEDLDAVKPVASRLKSNGAYSIFDYAVEQDVPDETSKMGCLSARDGSDEKTFEVVMQNFVQCINTSAEASEDSVPFVAIKLTGLCDSKLLHRVSKYLTGKESVFRELSDSTNLLGYITPDSCHKGLVQMGINVDESEVDRLFKEIDVNNTGKLSLFEWIQDVHPEMKVYSILKSAQGSNYVLVDISEFERQQLRYAVDRLETLAKHAQERGVRILVDAEQTYLQPAIRHITTNHLMPKFNVHQSVIFNTIQGYLKESETTLLLDLISAERSNVHYGVKLVRGAYMEQEREEATKNNYEDPIWESKENTDHNYHKLLDILLRKMQVESNICAMVATHNETSVLSATNGMKLYNISRSSGRVMFGQLLGMCDHISFPLGNAGYTVYKYLPYGPVEKVIPYLIRRANENSALLGSESTKKMRNMLSEELKRRLFG